MARTGMVPRAAAAAALLAAAAASATATDTCRALSRFNLFTLGNLHLTATEVLGPLAVRGDARLESFAVNPVGRCGRRDRVPDTVALAVGGHLRARNGQINAGKVVVERRRFTRSSVGLRCARVVGRGAVDLDALASMAKRQHEQLCHKREAHCDTRVDEARGVTFSVRRRGDATCVVQAGQLARASRVVIRGRGRGQLVVIKVEGGSRYGRGGRPLRLSNFGFDGFVPARTVLAFCDVRKLVVDNVGVPSAVLAPATDLSGPAGHILGTSIFGSVRGGVEFRHAPFRCNDDDNDRRVASTEAAPSPSVDD